MFPIAAGPDTDFARLGIVSTDETLASVVVFHDGGGELQGVQGGAVLGGVDTTPSIPEASTWVMMLAGFAGLGFPRLPGVAPRNCSCCVNRTRGEHGPATSVPGAVAI